MGEEAAETVLTTNNLESKATSDAADDCGVILPCNDEDFVDDASQNSRRQQLKEKQEVSKSSVSLTAGSKEEAEAVPAHDTTAKICGGNAKHHDVAIVERNEVDVKMSTISQTTASGGGSAADTTANATATANAATAKGSTNNSSSKHIDGQLRSPPSKTRHHQQQHLMTYPLVQGYHHPHHPTHHPYHSAVAYSHHPAYHHPHHPAAYHHHSTKASFHHPPASATQTQGAPSSSSAPTSSQQHHWSNSAVQHAYSGYYKAYHHQQQLHHHHQQQQPQQTNSTAIPSNVSSNNPVAKKNQPTKLESSVDCDRQYQDAGHDASNDQCQEQETKCTKKNKSIEDENAILGGVTREAEDKNGNEEESSTTVMNGERNEDNMNSPEEGNDDVKGTGVDMMKKKKSAANRPDTIASSASMSAGVGVGAIASWNSQSDNDNVDLSLATSSSTTSSTAASKQQHPSHPTTAPYHTHYGWHHAAAAHHVSRGYHQYHFQQQHGYHPYHLQQQQNQHLQQQHNQSSQHQSQLFPQYHHPYWPGYGGHSQLNVAITATSSSSHHSGRSTQQQEVAGTQMATETKGTATIDTTEQRQEKMKKRNRNEPSSSMIDDARDDLNTNESFLSDEFYYEHDGDNAIQDNTHCNNVHCNEADDDDTATTGDGDLGSFAGISFDSLESSPKGKRRKGPPRACCASSALAGVTRRSQSIHRTKASGQLQANINANEDEDDTKLLEVSSTFSNDGKMILKNLSIHSNYSAELAQLCGPSPMNAAIDSNEMDMMKDGTDNDVEGRTPKKRNTTDKRREQKRAGVGPFEFRLDGFTPAPSFRRIVLGSSSSTMNMSHEDIINDSPTMFDLIGGAETPTTDMLMSNIMEAGMTDDIRCLNGHLRGQTFAPLHVDAGSGHSLVGGVSGNDSPQLSWSTTNGGSPLEITPRCFGLLDSAKSARSISSVEGGRGGRSHHPLGSPRSFWKDNILDQKGDEGARISEDTEKNGEQGGVKSILSILSPTMREMDISYDSVNYLEDGSQKATSPLPLYYNDGNHGQENCSSVSTKKVITPQRMPSNVPLSSGQVSHVHCSPWASDYQRHVRPQSGIAHSPIPHHHGSALPFSGGGPPHPHQGFYHNMMYDHSAHHQHPNDRVRNLRGNGPPRHQMPPQHHLPPPSYHHFSPLTNVASSGREDRYGGYPLLPHQLDMLSSSKRKCIPIKHPIPSKFQGDVEKYKDALIPEFNNLVNFPGHMSNKPSPNVPEGMRCCVMCGQACPCSTGGKIKKPVYSNSVTNVIGAGATGGNVAPLGDRTGNSTNQGIVSSSSSTMSSLSGVTVGNYASIPTQNKGLCTICDVNVWLVTSSGLEIKWCKGCKNFRPWAAFGDKGLATKCVRCRERQREKYALTKEEKDKKKSCGKEDLHYDNTQQQQVGQAAGAIDPLVGYQ